MKLPSARVLLAVGLPIFLFGLAIIPGWHIAGMVGVPDLATTEFPFGDLEDVAVDSRGRIYVGEGLHGARVQRYSPEGEFERGWFVPTSGAFALRTTPDGRVQVATIRGRELLTYTSDGDLLDSQHWSLQKEDRYSEFSSETDTTGPYVIRRGLMPRVIDTRTGRTVVATPWPKRLVAGPFPAMLYALVGVVLLWMSDRRQRREPAG